MAPAAFEARLTRHEHQVVSAACQAFAPQARRARGVANLLPGACQRGVGHRPAEQVPSLGIDNQYRRALVARPVMEQFPNRLAPAVAQRGGDRIDEELGARAGRECTAKPTAKAITTSDSQKPRNIFQNRRPMVMPRSPGQLVADTAHGLDR
jgi:hypothetical protein